MNHIAIGRALSLVGELLPPHHGRQQQEMAVESMEMASGAIPRPGRVPEQRVLSPEIGLRWRQRCGTFRGRRLNSLGFLPQREYIGGRAM
jgi:hypothetical protein